MLQVILVYIFTTWNNIPANIPLNEEISRRLDEDQKTVLVIRLQDVFKTFSRRLQDVLPRRLQDVFKTSCKNNLKTYSRRLQDVFKMSSRHLQDLFKTFSRRLQNVSQRSLQDVFKTYRQVKLFLLTRFQKDFETYSKRFWDVLQRRLSTERFAWVTLLRNLWWVYKICKSHISFSNFSFSLNCTF